MARYRCLNCGNEWQEAKLPPDGKFGGWHYPGPTYCRPCNPQGETGRVPHPYVKWLNFEELRARNFK
jgi:hypothetical protein